MTVVTLTPKQVFRHPATFAETFLHIQDKQNNLLRFRHNLAQSIYARNRVKYNIILKARQLGFSTFILGEHFRIATTRSANVTTITDKDSNTQGFRRRVDRFYNHLPEDFRPTRKYSNATVSTYPDTDSEWRIETAGSGDVGRSTTNTHIHGSEVAFWTDPRAIMRGLMEAGNPAVELESTANGAFGYFYDLCMETLGNVTEVQDYHVDGANGWRLHFFAWWINPEYAEPVPPDFAYDQDPEVNTWGFTSEAELAVKHSLSNAQIMWRRGKIKKLKNDFIQEYPEDPLTCFVVSGSSYFGLLADTFTLPDSNADPITGHEYVAGLDFGQDNDFTACVVLDKTVNQMVALYRQRHAEWGEMRGECVKLFKRYGVSAVVAEKNSMGSTNTEELRKEISRERLNTHVEEFVTSNPSKADIMVALRDWLHEKGGKLMNNPVLKQEIRKYQRTRLPGGGWKLSAPDGVEEHDDTVIALALALQACAAGGSTVSLSPIVTAPSGRGRR